MGRLEVYQLEPIDRVAKRVARGATYGGDLDREKERAKTLERIEELDEKARCMKYRRHQLNLESTRKSANGVDTTEIEQVCAEITAQLDELKKEREQLHKWLRLNGQKVRKRLDWDSTLAFIVEKLIDIERKVDSLTASEDE